MKRQGDLLIVKVKGIPKNSKNRDNRILAEGEATGHMHELDLGEVYEKDGMLYFRVPEGKVATLNHQEHGAMTFEAGDYKVTRQREYAPGEWKQDWRLVTD